MRRLEEYEEIGLIGYPRDGDYIAVLGGPKRQSWLLGGELCGLDGAALADQALDLPRFYPQGSRLVLVTITDNWIIALRDYDTAAIGQKQTVDSEDRFGPRTGRSKQPTALRSSSCRDAAQVGVTVV